MSGGNSGIRSLREAGLSGAAAGKAGVSSQSRYGRRGRAHTSGPGKSPPILRCLADRYTIQFRSRKSSPTSVNWIGMLSG